MNSKPSSACSVSIQKHSIVLSVKLFHLLADDATAKLKTRLQEKTYRRRLTTKDAAITSQRLHEGVDRPSKTAAAFFCQVSRQIIIAHLVVIAAKGQATVPAPGEVRHRKGKGHDGTGRRRLPAPTCTERQPSSTAGKRT